MFGLPVVTKLRDTYLMYYDAYHDEKTIRRADSCDEEAKYVREHG